jgi:hypothetical protein
MADFLRHFLPRGYETARMAFRKGHAVNEAYQGVELGRMCGQWCGGLGSEERTWAGEVVLDGVGERLCGVSVCQASVGRRVSRANRTKLYAVATR